jgi:hypothetical protein
MNFASQFPMHVPIGSPDAPLRFLPLPCFLGNLSCPGGFVMTRLVGYLPSTTRASSCVSCYEFHNYMRERVHGRRAWHARFRQFIGPECGMTKLKAPLSRDDLDPVRHAKLTGFTFGYESRSCGACSGEASNPFKLRAVRNVKQG